LSGGVIQNFTQFFNSANIASLAETTCYNKITFGIRPAINNYFISKHIPNLIAELKGSRSIIADGRFSSPGHFATKCTVSFIDEQTSKIIKLVNTDVRKYSGVSQRMEPNETKKGLDQLLNEDKVCIKEFVTDAHKSIRKFMREEFPSVCHQNDIWHKNKSLFKRLGKVKYKNIHLPNVWIARIRSYMYKSLKTGKGDIGTSKALWRRFVQHDCDKYEEHKYGTHYPSCSKLFKDNNHLFNELYYVMVSFEKDFNYYTNCKNTCKVESFHNVILKYAPKRIPFRTNYGMRVQLAALDWNHMQDTKAIRDVEKWNNITKKFAINLRKPKNFNYHKDIIRDFINSNYVTTPHNTNYNQNYPTLFQQYISQKQSNKYLYTLFVFLFN
jgi:hypothetical protein